MGHHSEAFIGIDTSKLKNAVAIAEAGRDGEVRDLGELDTSPAVTRKLVMRLAGRYEKLTFCYEAGPTGFGLHRQITGLGHECLVAAPSLIPRKAGDRVKTNRRDARGLARNLRAGELTAVWVPDERHEAMRDLSRAREAAASDMKRARQRILSMLLRLGLIYRSTKPWTKAHRNWLAGVKLAHREQRIAFEELIAAEREAGARVGRLEQAIREAVPDWSLEPLVVALQAARGIDVVVAVTVLAEIGDLSRFASPRELMGYIGLVPSEDSTGDKVRRGPITKAGNARVRRVLTEAAWAYRHPPRIGKEKRAKVEAAPEAVRAIAWKAQMRLCGRYRALMKKGKQKNVVTTAIARELAGFIWAIGREMQPAIKAAARG